MQFFDAYNLLDVFIGGTLLITLALGVWKGFLRSLTGLAGLAVGVLAAAKYYPEVQPYLAKISSLDPHISMVLSMAAIFVATQVIFVVIRRILDALLDVTRLSWLDRSFGAAMGLAAGFLVVAAAVQLVLLGIPEWPVVKESRLAAPVDELTRKAMTYAPKSATKQFHALVEKWKDGRENPRASTGSKSDAEEADDTARPNKTPAGETGARPGPTAAARPNKSPAAPPMERN